MFWVTVGLATIFLFYKWLFQPQKTWIKRNVKQVGSTPIVGENYDMLLRKESIFDMIKRVYNVFPNERYVGFHQMTKPLLMIRDLELLKQLTVKDFDHFMDHRDFVSRNSDPLWSKNLFALKGEEWRDMRSTLSPAFTGSKMRTMFSLINDCSKQLSSYFLSKNEDKIELEMKDTFTRYANDVIATCAFGITVDSLKDRENEFYIKGKIATNFGGLKRTLKMMIGLASPALARFFNIKMFDDDLSNFFTKIISESIQLRQTKHIVRPDLINLLMEARKGKLRHDEVSEEKDAGFATIEESHIGKVEKEHVREISDNDITAQALIFFFAGFDTVSTALSFFAYELAANPKIQDKLIEEVDETWKTNNGVITYDSLGKMKYMDMVTSEVLRKWPPAVATDRVCVKPYTIEPVNPGEQPLKIYVDEVLSIPTAALHYDPQYFENPENFDPERFNDENKHKINPYAYMPFGVGPRGCIGSRFALMEVKTVIFNILTKFKFVPTKKTVIPIQVDKTQFIALTADGGFWMAIQKR